MNSKLIGGTLLVVGTTIGAGMLALPVATAELGFWGSLIQLISCWVIMTVCALLFLEVNLWLPPNNNLISMAGATLGWAAQAIVWVLYLLLLYSIICAYIAGGGDLLHYLANSHGLPLSQASASILFTFALGTIVFFGIRCVDYFNRAFMLGKFAAYVFIVVLILPFISIPKLSAGNMHYILSPNSLTVTAISFGSLMIIPSLRTYLDGDLKLLRKAIFIGFLIPLVCYIAWDLVIKGIIPIEGIPGLKQILHSNRANSDLVIALQTILNNSKITLLVKFFTAICMATSFLSISLSLSDFLADGFGVGKKGLGSLLVYSGTFLPPVLVVIFYPNAFIRSLNYAGLCCFILMVLLPPLMVWRGRYHKDLAVGTYRMACGRGLLVLLMLFATVMIGMGLEGTI